MADNVSALRLLLGADPALFAIVKLSLTVSLGAVTCAALTGIPFGALIALTRFPGRAAEARFSLVTAVLAGFGRAAAEVGAVIIVGGNIDGYTRTMTTAIALETSKGDLPLALGLGIVLMTITERR